MMTSRAIGKILLGILLVFCMVPTISGESTPVDIELKTGSEYHGVVDSVFWWGLRFADQNSVMYRQLKYLETGSESLTKSIQQHVPAVKINTQAAGYQMDFEAVTSHQYVEEQHRLISSSSLQANILTEKAEQLEVQLNFVPQQAPYLVGSIATSMGVLWEKEDSYSNPAELPGEGNIVHMVFSYTVGLGYRQTFGRSAITLKPTFSKKSHTATQNGVVVEGVSDVAFYLAANYDYHILRNRYYFSLGGRYYFTNIPAQERASSFAINIGFGYKIQ